jgi:hypothetical protein
MAAIAITARVERFFHFGNEISENLIFVKITMEETENKITSIHLKENQLRDDAIYILTKITNIPIIHFAK